MLVLLAALLFIIPVLQEQPLAIVGATIIDGTGSPPLANGIVLVRGSRIAAVGPSTTVNVPPDARRIDAAGMWLIPGLIDMHVHMDEVITPSSFVLFGVTSVRDVGSRLVTIERLRARAAKGEIIPRLFWMGRNIDEGKPSWWGAVAVKGPTEVPALIAGMAKQGVDGVKLYTDSGPEVTRAVIIEAHKRGWLVTGHLSKTRPSQAAAMGIDNLEHVSTLLQELRHVPGKPKSGFAAGFQGISEVDLNGVASNKLVQILLQNHVAITPTLITSLLPVEGEKAATKAYSGLADIPMGWQNYWNSPYWSFMSTKGWKRQDFTAAHSAQTKYRQMLGKLYKAGVPIVTGTDTPAPWVMPGAGTLFEIELMVKAGMTSLSVILSSTGRAAEVLHKSADVGTIRPGRYADMVLLDADPTIDIRNLRRIHAVILSGHEVDREDIRFKLKVGSDRP